MRYSFVLVLSVFLFVSCKPKSEVQTNTDSTTAVTPPPAQSIQSTPTPVLPRLTAGKHGDTTVTATGLMIIETKVGKGAVPKSGQTITVNYTGQFLDGKPFDSNVDPNFHHVEPFVTPIGVGKVIPGWDEGILTMKVGGKRRLLVPANLAYGEHGMGDIPPNAPLIFDVELLKVQ